MDSLLMSVTSVNREREKKGYPFPRLMHSKMVERDIAKNFLNCLNCLNCLNGVRKKSF